MAKSSSSLPTLKQLIEWDARACVRIQQRGSVAGFLERRQRDASVSWRYPCRRRARRMSMWMIGQ